MSRRKSNTKKKNEEVVKPEIEKNEEIPASNDGMPKEELTVELDPKVDEEVKVDIPAKKTKKAKKEDKDSDVVKLLKTIPDTKGSEKATVSQLIQSMRKFIFTVKNNIDDKYSDANLFKAYNELINSGYCEPVDFFHAEYEWTGDDAAKKAYYGLMGALEMLRSGDAKNIDATSVSREFIGQYAEIGSSLQSTIHR